MRRDDETATATATMTMMMTRRDDYAGDGLVAGLKWQNCDTLCLSGIIIWTFCDDRP
jgi:hypothetical protein